MEEMEDYCNWHCSCKVLLGKRPFSNYKVYQSQIQKQSRKEKESLIQEQDNYTQQTERSENVSIACLSLSATPIKRDEKLDQLEHESDVGCPSTESKNEDNAVVEGVHEDAEHGIDDLTVSTENDHIPAADVSPLGRLNKRLLTLVKSETGSPITRRFDTGDSNVNSEEEGRPIEVIIPLDGNDETNSIVDTDSVNAELPSSEISEDEQATLNSEEIETTSNQLSQTAPPPYNCRNRSQFHKCRECGKMFGQLSSLQRHEKEHVLEAAKHFECVDCGKSYSTLASYERHLKVHPKCLLCRKSMSVKEIESQVQGDGLNVNVCKKCRSIDAPVIFRRKSQSESSPDSVSLASSNENEGHVEIELPSNQYPDANGHGLKPKTPARISMNQRKGSVKVKAEISKNGLDDDDDVEAYYHCRYCPDGFTSTAEVDDHETAVHGPERPYECSYCPARFKAEFHRQKHEAVHTDEQRFDCPSCGQAYNQRTRLRAHMQKSHNLSLDEIVTE